jgi:hexosaminidase
VAGKTNRAGRSKSTSSPPARGVRKIKFPDLLPAPKSVQHDHGTFAFTRNIPIVLSPGADEASSASADVLRNAIERACKVRLPIEVHLRRSDLGRHVALGHTGGAPGTACDRYRIIVSDDVVEVRAGGPSGLRYAVETLVQLIQPGGSLPGCVIEDEPDFAMRGIMLDVSRGKVPTLESLCGLVDVLVKLKLNTLMLYTEHTFQFRRHPKIGATDSPLDSETMRALDAYAHERHVELIPCLQSLGHMDHILMLPQYHDLAETEVGWTIAPTRPESLELLRDMYDEYLPNFRSRFFNANCDEPWDLGKGQSKERSEELGPGGLYLEHVTALRALAQRSGKRTMIWADVVHAHPKRIGEIPKDMVMLDWGYEAEYNYDRISVFQQNKLEFAVCPGTSTWNSLFPRVENSTVNISNWAKAGLEYGALGFITTDWGDFGHYNLLGNSWFAYAVSAQQSWSGACDNTSFARAFGARVFGDQSGGDTAARLYKALGAIHDVGFNVFNGSPLAYLFFDTLEESYFIEGCKQGALARTQKKLKRVRNEIEDAKDFFAIERASWRELLYAADASLHAVDKAIVGRRYNAWRRKPKSLDARARKRLAIELLELAKKQSALLTRFRRLWLARSAISNFDLTQGRVKRSVKSLRDAAKLLSHNEPPSPVTRKPIDMPGVTAAVRRSFGASE